LDLSKTRLSNARVDIGTLLVVAVIGAGAGFLGGLFGKGGAALATPLLAAVGIPPIVAVASPLPATLPSTLAAATPYWKARLIDWRVVRWSVAVGVPATVVGALATRWIDGGSLVLATEVLLTGLGVRMLLRPGDPHEVVVEPDGFRSRVVLVAAGVGLSAGLLANAGGFLLAPLFVLVLRLGIKPSLATSLAVAMVLAIPGTIVHAALGHVDWTVTLVFAVTSVPLANLGARVALRTHPVVLERAYGAGLALVGAALLLVTL
jgi:uncharacterized membrane protein YfcA